MIVNVRGTSGSGKSWLVRSILELYDTKLPFFVGDRKRPVGYLFKRTHVDGIVRANKRDLWVPGHYETPCGGCDTIPTLDMVFDLVRRGHDHGHDVLFEGLLVNSDRNRTVDMHKEGLPLTIVTLATSVEVCLSSVQDRRDERAKNRKGGPGEAKPLNPRNTTNRHALATKNHEVFREKGLTSWLLDREEAATMVRSYLKL